jgi:hypothetical protein
VSEEQFAVALHRYMGLHPSPPLNNDSKLTDMISEIQSSGGEAAVKRLITLPPVVELPLTVKELQLYGPIITGQAAGAVIRGVFLAFKDTLTLASQSRYYPIDPRRGEVSHDPLSDGGDSSHVSVPPSHVCDGPSSPSSSPPSLISTRKLCPNDFNSTDLASLCLGPNAMTQLLSALTVTVPAIIAPHTDEGGDNNERTVALTTSQYYTLLRLYGSDPATGLAITAFFKSSEYADWWGSLGPSQNMVFAPSDSGTVPIVQQLSRRGLFYFLSHPVVATMIGGLYVSPYVISPARSGLVSSLVYRDRAKLAGEEEKMLRQVDMLTKALNRPLDSSNSYDSDDEDSEGGEDTNDEGADEHTVCGAELPVYMRVQLLTERGAVKLQLLEHGMDGMGRVSISSVFQDCNEAILLDGRSVAAYQHRAKAFSLLAGLASPRCEVLDEPGDDEGLDVDPAALADTLSQGRIVLYCVRSHCNHYKTSQIRHSRWLCHEGRMRIVHSIAA